MIRTQSSGRSRFVFFMLAAAALMAAAGLSARAQKPAQEWMTAFAATPADLATTGENPYFILTPGYQLVLEGKESGKSIKLTITVLNETRKIGAFEARIVEERETEDGVLAEVSRNYFAIHKTTKDLFYFGEDVDVYKNGKVANHEGAWLHGTGGAKFGMMMPGAVRPGLRFYQEQAPTIAMDRSEIQKVDDRLTTKAGTFERCVKTEETTPLEPGAREYKLYAPGVGLIKDGVLELVSYTKK